MNEPDSGISREPLQGHYTNYCRVGQNAMEFIVDFGERYGETDAPLFHTRLITTPIYMKAIVSALEEALEIHCRRFSANMERD